MYKLIGAIMICFSCGGFFWRKVQAICQKYENLKQIKKALIYMKQELSFSSVELSQLLDKTAENVSGDISQVLGKMARILTTDKTMDIKSAWKKSKGSELLLSDEAKKITEDYFYNIGTKSLDIEIEKTEKTISAFELLDKEEREKMAKDKKLLYTVGASVAAAIVILVI